MTQQTKLIIGMSSGILALSILGVLISFGVVELPRGARQEVTVDENPDKQLGNQDAFSMAQDRALDWHADAVLAYSATAAGKTDAAGRSDSWELIFTSPSVVGKGLRVLIQDRRIATTEEIQYSRKGSAIPENLIPSDQAADYVRTMKGYENEQILSVELLYESKVNTWFWGVKTSKGVVAIKATP